MDGKLFFWIAAVLIAEPVLAALWPRLRIVGMLSFPISIAKLFQVETYCYDLEHSHRLGVMMPLRKRIRRYMQAIGVIILMVLVIDNLYKLNLF